MEFGWEEILGLVAGICTTIAMIPQIRKAWNFKQVEDVSLGLNSVMAYMMIKYKRNAKK